jgi:membrane associated rhomboid family serine protease
VSEPGPPNQTAPPAVCWWHPTRQTGLSCARCGRPACTDCLREAAVGHQCIDCVHAARQEQPRVRRSPVSARLSARPVVTPVLIALNVLLYVVTTVQAHSPVDNDQATLFGDWVLWPRAIAGGGQWWRLLTSGFLHYGPVHIGVNMIALWVLGQDVERVLGKARFTAVYLVSLLGGAVSVYLFDDSNRPTAGASGAIYGLLGGILVVVLRLRLNPMSAIAMIVLNLIITVSIPNISLLGHLGGLMVGALTTAAIVYAPINGRRGWQVASVVVLVVALAALIWYRDTQLSGVMFPVRRW